MVENKRNADGGGDAEKKKFPTCPTQNKKKQEIATNKSMKRCRCVFVSQRYKLKKNVKTSSLRSVTVRRVLVFLLHKQSCKWDLYKFVLISWPGAASRYLLHRRILIAASRVGRSLGSQCTEDEMQQAAVAWRGASSAEPPRSRRLHSDMAGSTLAPDLSVTFVLKITLLLSRRGVRDARES